MDITLQRHCAKYIYIVPDGLRELLSDISREVLRSQPKDIYTFIADYLDALMITRENARVAAKFVQQLTEIAENIVELLETTGMSREEADDVSVVIQNAFLNYTQKKGILKEDEDAMVSKIIEDAHIGDEHAEEAAIVIQNAYQEFKLRHEKEKKMLSGFIDWRVAARSAIKLYRRTGVSTEEAKRAATLIKAAYKGYYTRRALMKLKEANAILEEQDTSVSIGEQGSYMDDDVVSVTSKNKSVRIDFSSVVPHVDFSDKILISPTETSEDITGQSSCEIFIRELLTEKVLSTILEEKESEGVMPVENVEVEEVKSTEKTDMDEVENLQEIPTEVLPETEEQIHEDKSNDPTDQPQVQPDQPEIQPTTEIQPESQPTPEIPPEDQTMNENAPEINNETQNFNPVVEAENQNQPEIQNPPEDTIENKGV